MRPARGTFRSIILASAVTGLLTSSATAAPVGAPGSLDHTFHGTGRVEIKTARRANAVAHQGPKIVLAGSVDRASSDILVIRLDANGKVDRTFGGGDGRFTKDVFGDDDVAAAVAVLRDGRLLVAGFSYDPGIPGAEFIVLRLTPNGRLDRTFGVGGLVTTTFPGISSYGNAITVRSDGKFVVCGTSVDAMNVRSFALARYRPGGGLDGTFGTGGRIETGFPGQDDAYCQAVTNSGKQTVAAGFSTQGSARSIAVARFDDAGVPDASFSADGFGVFSPTIDTIAWGVLALRGGKVVTAGMGYGGASGADVALLQLTAAGAPDPRFGGGDGFVLSDLGGADEAMALARQRDGSLVVVGDQDNDMMVARYRRTGHLDRGFGHRGVQAKPWSDLTVGSCVALVNGRAVVAGLGPSGGLAVERVLI
jgi:uncharacterized delta-60 repeat protein